MGFLWDIDGDSDGDGIPDSIEYPVGGGGIDVPNGDVTCAETLADYFDFYPFPQK